MSKFGLIVGLVLALVKLIWSWVLWAKETAARKAGADEQQRRELEASMERQRQAKEAADRVRATALRDPAGVLRDDDGFRRD